MNFYDFQKETKKLFFPFLVIFCCYIVISFPYIIDDNYFRPDADRIIMDGILILDFIKDLPASIANPYEYITHYYAKYPALSIGYRPIFFQTIEALFYSIFGVSHVVSKLSVLFFLSVGMYFWLRLVTKTNNFTLGLISLGIWITNPMIFKYSQQPMLEIPTLSMIIVSIYYIHDYYTNSSYKKSIVMAIAVGLTLWTNQKSAFILITILLYPFLSGAWRQIFSKTNLFSYFILLFFIVPLAAMTLLLGAQNLAQSIGIGLHTQSMWGRFFSFNEFSENLLFLVNNHFSILLMIFIMIGMGIAVVKKREQIVIYISVIFSNYIFFTYIKHDLPRYSMYWIPFFSFFAAYATTEIANYLSKFTNQNKILKYCIFFIPIIFQLSFLPGTNVPTLTGYSEAAKYVVQHSESPVILFDGYANGHFIFFVNVNDRNRDFIVLRGDKLITSSSIKYKNMIQYHLKTNKEIYDAIVHMGVQLIVVESVNVSQLEIYAELRKLLKDESKFKLIKTFEIITNRSELKGHTLLVYKNQNWPGVDPEQPLILNLPVIGKKIEFKMKRVLADP